MCSSHFSFFKHSSFVASSNMNISSPTPLHAHRKDPRCCFNTDFPSQAPAAWLRIHIFKHLSAREVTLERGKGAERVEGLIPLIQRHRLKSFVRQKQTSCQLKLPPPTYPAATLQLFWNQSKIKSAAPFMHQTKRFLSHIPIMFFF